MITYKTTLHKFAEKGEKTGWTYINVPQDVAQQIKPNCRTSYRVKGLLDAFEIKQVALVPMGEGDFIMAINAGMRKGIQKAEGAELFVQLELDESEFVFSSDFLESLQDEPQALEAFNKMAPSHQKYYSNWIEDAKTIETKSKRIYQALFGLANGLNYGEMIRHFKAKNNP
jgi:hypothetical protein